MKRTLAGMGIVGLTLCAGLAACTAPRNAQEVSQKTVHYNCGDQPLTVQYTFQGTEALAAKVIYKDQAVDLTRTTSTNADMVGNTFRGNSYTWTTLPFTINDVQNVDGNMLTQDVHQVVNGQTNQLSNILAKSCKVAP